MSNLPKATAPLLIVASLLLIVSLSTNHWIEIEGGVSFAGLFLFCENAVCSGDRRLTADFRGIVQTSAGFTILALLSSTCAAILWSVEAVRGKKDCVNAGLLFAFLSCVFLLVACCIFAEAGKYRQAFGFSYFVTWGAFLAAFIAFLLGGAEFLNLVSRYRVQCV